MLRLRWWGLTWLLVANCASARDWTVDARDDGVDVAVGDGLCQSAAGTCTLRAAVQEANASPGADTLWLGSPEGVGLTYRLSLGSGAGEDLAASGDLDVRQDLLIALVPEQRPGLAEIGSEAGALDRVFDVHAPAKLRLEQIVVAGGNLPDPQDLGAGVRVRPGAHLRMDHSVLYANFAAGNGSALGNEGRSELYGGVVFDNHHTRTDLTLEGGGTLYAGVGAELVVEDTLVIGNANFRGAAITAEGAGARVSLRRALLELNHGDLHLSAGAHIDAENLSLRSAESIRVDSGATLSLSQVTLLPANSGRFLFVAPASAVTIANSIVDLTPAACEANVGSVQSSGGNLFRPDPPCEVVLQLSDRAVASMGLVRVDQRWRSLIPGLSNYGFAPAPGSAARGLGANCPPVDQFGWPRPAQACDAGALESGVEWLVGSGFE